MKNQEIKQGNNVTKGECNEIDKLHVCCGGGTLVAAGSVTHKPCSEDPDALHDTCSADPGTLHGQNTCGSHASLCNTQGEALYIRNKG